VLLQNEDNLDFNINMLSSQIFENNKRVIWMFFIISQVISLIQF